MAGIAILCVAGLSVLIGVGCAIAVLIDERKR